MGGIIVIGIISVLLGGVGLAMVTFPSIWVGWSVRSLSDPSSRFLVTQGMVLAGLLLVIGTTSWQGFWLWVTVGSLTVGLAMVMLGASEHFRQQLATIVQRSPLWAHRLGGVLMVILATLLAMDLIRHG